MNDRKAHFLSVLGIGLLALVAGRAMLAAGLEADMVILNGKILTADSPDPNNFTIAQAAAIYQGKFISVGSNEEALQYAGPSTQRIDLGGRMVLPGLVETHNHIYGYGAHYFPKEKPQVGDSDPSVSLEWTSEPEFLAQIRTLTLKKKPGEWIILSSGRATAELQKGEVTRLELDNVAPNNPVVLYWGGGGAGGDSVVNTKALEPLLARYPNIPGVRRHDQGVPTGRLAGLAHWTLTYEFFPMLPADELGPLYKLEMEEMAAQGVTTISTRLHPNHLAAYAWLHARGEIPLCVPPRPLR